MTSRLTEIRIPHVSGLTDPYFESPDLAIHRLRAQLLLLITVHYQTNAWVWHNQSIKHDTERKMSPDKIHGSGNRW